MQGTMIEVDIEEFRQDLIRYAIGDSPVTITRDGLPVGCFMPVHPRPSEEDLRTMREAVKRTEALLAEHGITEDEVVREFNEPVHPRPSEKDLKIMRQAGEKLRALMAEHGITEDEVVREFDELRHRS